jgi:nicotinamidase-related amidase
VQARSALLIIDVQVGRIKTNARGGSSKRAAQDQSYSHEGAQFKNSVIHIQHDGPKGHQLGTHTEGWKIHASFTPADGESIINKRELDTFFETGLHRDLKKRDHALYYRGGMTEYCVTRSAVVPSLGYDGTLASDADLSRPY